MKSISNSLRKIFGTKRHVGYMTGLLLVAGIFVWTQPTLQQTGTIKIRDRNNTLLYESAGTVGRQMPVGYDALPQHLIDAVIASEDSTFWTNPGIDIKAIVRALVANIQEGHIVSGGSTITQQLARSSVISSPSATNRSWLRKIREIIIALRLNMAYTKKDILTRYLNAMYFGNLSYGIEAASQTYFGKQVSSLSKAESAFLAGLISSPVDRNPYTDMQTAKNRQRYVLTHMVNRGFLNQKQADEASAEPLVIMPRTDTIKAPHFVQYILGELEQIPLSTHTGINVYTTLDYPIFTLSEDIARQRIKEISSRHDVHNAALVTLKNDTGEILAMLGGIDYFDATNSGQINMAATPRQPGSALKPVTYAAAFMKGFTPATLIYDVATVYPTKKGEGFAPNNYDGTFHGLVLVREALASSLNVPAVEMLYRIGIDQLLTVAKNMGITTFTQEDRYDLSITLGGGEVTLLDLTNVYADFAREGVFVKPFAIVKITADDGKTLYQHRLQETKTILGKNSRQIAYLISNILSDPKARIPAFGEKNPLVLSHPAAVKTGTTTDWHDNWTIGYTPSYTVGVWVGNNDNHPMRAITSIVGAAPIWNQFFEEFLKGKPTEQFVQPDRIKKVEICALSGQLVDGICPERTSELFIDGTEPTEQSRLHKEIAIDSRNGLLAGPSCPETVVQKKIYVDYPREVYSWAVANNQDTIPTDYSPLCANKSVINTESYLTITYPKNQAVFETAPTILTNEAIVFEVQVSSAIIGVAWYVDDSIVGTVSAFPFRMSWQPRTGMHTVYAEGINRTNDHFKSNVVHFTVISYKNNY